MADDSATPETIVDAAYRYISFAAGGDPRWEHFRKLFDPRAVLALRVFPDDASVRIMTLDQYVHIQMRSGMKETGYEEKPVSKVVERVGDVAQVRSNFMMIFGTGAIYDALDLFQLAWCEGRWRIVSIISDFQQA